MNTKIKQFIIHHWVWVLPVTMFIIYISCSVFNPTFWLKDKNNFLLSVFYLPVTIAIYFLAIHFGKKVKKCWKFFLNIICIISYCIAVLSVITPLVLSVRGLAWHVKKDAYTQQLGDEIIEYYDTNGLLPSYDKMEKALERYSYGYNNSLRLCKLKSLPTNTVLIYTSPMCSSFIHSSVQDVMQSIKEHKYIYAYVLSANVVIITEENLSEFNFDCRIKKKL